MRSDNFGLSAPFCHKYGNYNFSHMQYNNFLLFECSDGFVFDSTNNTCVTLPENINKCDTDSINRYYHNQREDYFDGTIRCVFGRVLFYE